MTKEILENETIEPEIVEKEFEDADKFEQDIYKNMTNNVSKIAKGNPKEIINALNNIVNIANKTIQFEKYQKTKRIKIDAERDIAIKKIEVDREIIMTYLNKSFDERKNNFEKMFLVLNNAITQGNSMNIAKTLDGIIQLASSSPFKDLGNIKEVQKALKDKNHEWEI